MFLAISLLIAYSPIIIVAVMIATMIGDAIDAFKSL